MTIIWRKDVFIDWRYIYTDQLMLQQKKEKMIKQMRKKNLQKRLKVCRQRELMKQELQNILKSYSLCALVSGENDYHNHTCYLDCEAFVINCHIQFQRIIYNVGVDEVKDILIEYRLPENLADISNVIENKTLELEYEEQERHILSRNVVLTTICQIVSLMTEEYQLVREKGDIFIELLAKQIARKFTQKKEFDKSMAFPFEGLVNMFSYEQFQTKIYEQLRQSNFEFMMEKFCSKIFARAEFIYNIQVSTIIFILLRYYLQYQIQATDEKLWPKFQRFLGTFVVHNIKNNIQIDNQIDQECSQNLFIDELLKLSLCVNFKTQDELYILKNAALFKKMLYVELLNVWSDRNQEISLALFTDMEISQMLQCAKQRRNQQDFRLFRQKLASSFVNLLEKAKQGESQTIRLWTLLQRSNSVPIFYDPESQNQDVKCLTAIFDLFVEQKN